jgi:hypothetical protein
VIWNAIADVGDQLIAGFKAMGRDMVRRWKRSDLIRAIDPVSIPWWVGLLIILWISRERAGAWINPGTALRPIDIAAVLFAIGCVAMSGRGFLRLGAWAVLGQHMFITAPILLAVGMLNPALGISLAAVLHVIAARIGRYLAKELEVRPPWMCRKCEYDLRGVTGLVCPECGTVIAGPAREEACQAAGE